MLTQYKISWIHTVLLLFICLMINSCDKIVKYNFYVSNSSDSLINVYFEDYKGKSNSLNISSTQTVQIYTAEGLNKFYNDKIELTFTKFIVSQNLDTSKNDYINKNKWIFNVLSDTVAEYKLIIDNNDFDR